MPLRTKTATGHCRVGNGFGHKKVNITANNGNWSYSTASFTACFILLDIILVAATGGGEGGSSPMAMAMEPPGAIVLLLEWANSLHGHPWNLTQDPCTWRGIQCDPSTQHFQYLLINSSNIAQNVFGMSGPVPDLPRWKASGYFPDFRFIYLRGARFGPAFPSWLIEDDYWQSGWETPTTEMISTWRWKFWVRYFNRYPLPSSNPTAIPRYQYYCDDCAGQGCFPFTGCFQAFVCPFSPILASMSPQEGVDLGVTCSNANIVSRTPTYGPTSGGNLVTFRLNIPAKYYQVSCLFDDPEITHVGEVSNVPLSSHSMAENLTYIIDDSLYIGRYFQVDVACRAPPHAPGRVNVHLYANGSRLTSYGIPYDYDCPPGSEQHTGAGGDNLTITCWSCPQGTYSNTHGGQCQPCPLNTYANKEGSAQCTACPVNHVTATTGSTDFSNCIPCGAGYFFDNITQSCQPCPFGYYTDAPAKSQCLACEAGFYSAPGLAGVRCLQCPAGQYGAIDPVHNAATCYDCPLSTYTYIPGMTHCIACLPGFQTSVTSGASSCKEQCPTGYYSVLMIGSQPWNNPNMTNVLEMPSEADAWPTNVTIGCIQCPPGYFSPSPGQPMCKPCHVGYFSDLYGAKECTKCETGFKTEKLGSRQCVEIPRITAEDSAVGGWAIAILLAVLAVAIATVTIIYVLKKRRQHAEIKRQIQESVESARL